MASAALREIISQIEKSGGEAELILAEGNAAETISKIAKERDYSMVIVGKHGQNWIESMVIGSTAQKVCETAGRPVLMVPLAVKG